MQKSGEVIHLSASDLVGHLNCRHLTVLDLSVAEGTLKKPTRWDPLLDILRERGRRHEAAFLEHLKQQGLVVEVIGGVEITPEAVMRTREAMAAGAQVII